MIGCFSPTCIHIPPQAFAIESLEISGCLLGLPRFLLAGEPDTLEGSSYWMLAHREHTRASRLGVHGGSSYQIGQKKMNENGASSKTSGFGNDVFLLLRSAFEPSQSLNAAVSRKVEWEPHATRS